MGMRVTAPGRLPAAASRPRALTFSLQSRRGEAPFSGHKAKDRALGACPDALVQIPMKNPGWRALCKSGRGGLRGRNLARSQARRREKWLPSKLTMQSGSNPPTGRGPSARGPRRQSKTRKAIGIDAASTEAGGMDAASSQPGFPHGSTHLSSLSGPLSRPGMGIHQPTLPQQAIIPP